LNEKVADHATPSTRKNERIKSFKNQKLNFEVNTCSVSYTEDGKEYVERITVQEDTEIQRNNRTIC
jgi:hypothetical protein